MFLPRLICLELVLAIFKERSWNKRERVKLIKHIPPLISKLSRCMLERFQNLTRTRAYMVTNLGSERTGFVDQTTWSMNSEFQDILVISKVFKVKTCVIIHSEKLLPKHLPRDILLDMI